MALIPCKMCGAMISQHAQTCPKCGAYGSPRSTGAVPAYQQQVSQMTPFVEQPVNQIPQKVGRWNWGAFTFGWLWGICNGVYWPLVTLIPYVGWVVGIGIAIFLGARGSEYAWKSRRWAYHSPEQFDRAQRGWNIAAGIVWGIAGFALICLLSILTAWSTEY